MKEMKPSGVEWIGDIPSDWGIAKLGCTHFIKGRVGWQGLSADEFIDEGPYLVTGTDFDKGRVDWSRCYHVSEMRYQMDLAIRVLDGDVLFTKDGTVGKVAFVENAPEKASLNSHLLIFRPLFEYSSNRFLFWVIQSDIFEVFKLLLQHGTVMASLGQTDMQKFLYPMPTFTEQRAIADRLDVETAKIDNALSLLQQQIETLEAYKRSLIHEAVTKGLNPNAPMKPSGVGWIGDIPESWECKRLKYLATEPGSLFIDGDWIEGDVIVPEGIRYLTTGNVGAGFYKEQGWGHITRQTFVSLSCLRVVPGDILISRLNLPIGRCCLAPDNEEEYVVAVDVCVLRPNSKCDKRYLVYCMNTDGYASAGESAARGTTMQRVSRSLLGNMILPVPSLDEQERIADYLDEKIVPIDKALTAKREQIEMLRKQRQSLIYEYVTGKRRVG